LPTLGATMLLELSGLARSLPLLCNLHGHGTWLPGMWTRVWWVDKCCMS